jgi:hypothetical protein
MHGTHKVILSGHPAVNRRTPVAKFEVRPNFLPPILAIPMPGTVASHISPKNNINPYTRFMLLRRGANKKGFIKSVNNLPNQKKLSLI